MRKPLVFAGIALGILLGLTIDQSVDAQGPIGRFTRLILNSATQVRTGTGTPEAAITAPVGSVFLRTDGSTGTTFYVKETGSGNTGWTAGGGGGGGGTTTIQTTTLTGTQNNFAATAARHLVLRANNATLTTFTGFAPGMDGDQIDLFSVGAGQVDLPHESGTSTAADRLLDIATSGITSLAAGTGNATFIYDGTTARWRLRNHNQGAWITPAFVAGNFTSGGTWTVDAGDVQVLRYFLHERHLTVAWVITTTTLGTASGTVSMVVPGGYTIANQFSAAQFYKDTAAAWIFGEVWGQASAPTTINFYTAGFGAGTAWQPGTNTLSSYGSVPIEVN